MVQTQNSLGGEVAEETNVVDETNNVAPAEQDPELGDLVCLPSMFNKETVIDDPNFVCVALNCVNQSATKHQ